VDNPRAFRRAALFISLLFSFAALTLIDVTIVDAHPPDGVSETGTVAEIPVPGVRIIREKDYDKQTANYLSSNLYTTLASGRDTFNKFVAFDFQVTPNGGPLPHTHSNEWETFFVHQGDVRFTVGVDNSKVGDEAFITEVIPAGTLVYGPQGPVHGFFNDSGKFARIFSFAMPAGLDNFFVTSGERVKDFNAPIPEITIEEIIRTAFWAEQRGDALYVPIPNTPAPPLGCLPEDQRLPGYVCPPSDHVIGSITDAPYAVGAFGESRVSLLTKEEAGNITGATAFCGPGIPGRPGGSVNYDYISLPHQDGVPALVTRPNIEVFYVLSGTLTFRFANGKVVRVPELTYVEIDKEVPFSINAPRRSGVATALNITVIPPPSCQGSFVQLPPSFNGLNRTPTGKLPGRESADEIMDRVRKRRR